MKYYIKSLEENLSEKDHQVILIRWKENPINLKRFPELALLYHIPNETQSAAERGQKKLMGMSNGVPDLCLPVARHGWHGLYIEMKKPKGRMSDSQKEWQKRLTEQGYRSVVCYGWKEAVEELTAYLGGDEFG